MSRLQEQGRYCQSLRYLFFPDSVMITGMKVFYPREQSFFELASDGLLFNVADFKSTANLSPTA